MITHTPLADAITRTVHAFQQLPHPSKGVSKIQLFCTGDDTGPDISLRNLPGTASAHARLAQAHQHQALVDDVRRIWESLALYPVINPSIFTLTLQQSNRNNTKVTFMGTTITPPNGTTLEAFLTQIDRLLVRLPHHKGRVFVTGDLETSAPNAGTAGIIRHILHRGMPPTKPPHILHQIREVFAQEIVEEEYRQALKALA